MALNSKPGDLLAWEVGADGRVAVRAHEALRGPHFAFEKSPAFTKLTFPGSRCFLSAATRSAGVSRETLSSNCLLNANVRPTTSRVSRGSPQRRAASPPMMAKRYPVAASDSCTSRAASSNRATSLIR